MAKIYSILEGGMIDIGPRRGEKPAPKMDDGALAAAIKYNQYLAEAIKAVEVKIKDATAAQVRAELLAKEADERAAKAEAKLEKIEQADTDEEAEALADINTAISELQTALGKLASDVKAIRDKPAPVVNIPKPEPAKPVVVPAPVVNMAEIISTIRAELARTPQSPGAVDTTVVERDANGYVKRFITKPVN